MIAVLPLTSGVVHIAAVPPVSTAIVVATAAATTTTAAATATTTAACACSCFGGVVVYVGDAPPMSVSIVSALIARGEGGGVTCLIAVIIDSRVDVIVVAPLWNAYGKVVVITGFHSLVCIHSSVTTIVIVVIIIIIAVMIFSVVVVNNAAIVINSAVIVVVARVVFGAVVSNSELCEAQPVDII